MLPAVLERLLDPLGRRFDADGGGESGGNMRLPSRYRDPLLPMSAPLLLPGSGEISPASSLRFGLMLKADRGDELPLTSVEPVEERGEKDGDSGRLNASRRAEMGRDGLQRTDLGTGFREDDDDDDDDFLSPRKVSGIASCCCCSDIRTGFGNCTCNEAEFCDAVQDFTSDESPSQSPFLRMKTESELHSLRLKLTKEIAQQETAEMNLFKMQNQWKRLTENLHKVGVSFPANRLDKEALLELDPAQIYQEIVYKRSVSHAIERDLSKIEAAADAEAVIDSKNQYISQLQRKLNYHKAVNREMSLRNQEIAFLARQQRDRRRKIRRWMWAWICLSATLGASWFASSYLDCYFEDHHDRSTAESQE